MRFNRSNLDQHSLYLTKWPRGIQRIYTHKLFWKFRPFIEVSECAEKSHQSLEKDSRPWCMWRRNLERSSMKKKLDEQSVRKYIKLQSRFSAYAKASCKYSIFLVYLFESFWSFLCVSRASNMVRPTLYRLRLKEHMEYFEQMALFHTQNLWLRTNDVRAS